MIGSRLGPYEITAKLGEGGMGEVYRARDSRLDREVAVKVLPAAFVADPERLARFEREAKVLAQLHHPNIASIFGLEEGDGTKALVMELVEGPTLAERLEQGPLPIDESLVIARQIAEGLEEAHEKGIVHRDLKPQVRWLVDGGFDPLYVPTGHLLYVKAKRLFALPFDAAKGVATGPAVAVVDDLHTSQSSAYAAYAVAPDGTLAFATETLTNPPSHLVWIDRQGAISNVLDEARRFLSASLSHDGRRAATTILGDSLDLWSVDVERRVLSRLTTGPESEFDPVWTADDRELIYVVDEPPFSLHRIALGSPDSGRPLWTGTVTRDTSEARLAPDGTRIAFKRSEPETGDDLYLRPLEDGAAERVLRGTRAEEAQPTFSPDSRWVAYASNESGRFEIYAERADGSGQRIQVSTDGGREPVWAASGELFFRHGDEMRVAAMRAADGLEVGSVRTLFRLPIASGAEEQQRTYDVAPDGSRVLAIYTPEETRPRQLEIVTSWLQHLPQLAPPARK